MSGKQNSGTGFLFNAIIGIIIAAVLGLGIYAVASKYIANHPKQEKSQTVADFIKDKKLTLDEFKTEYGLTDSEIKEDDDMNTVSAGMTLENYAKYTDSSLEELKEKYKLGDDAAADTKWQDAIYLMPTGVVSENFFGMDFDTFKSQAGLPDTITADTKWSETNSVMNEMYAAQQNAQGTESETGTADGSNAENNN